MAMRLTEQMRTYVPSTVIVWCVCFIYPESMFGNIYNHSTHNVITDVLILTFPEFPVVQ